MNRREAIAALGLTGVASIATLSPQAGEVLVVECDEYITDEIKDRIHQRLSEVFPDQKILVLDKHLTMKVVKA